MKHLIILFVAALLMLTQHFAYGQEYSKIRALHPLVAFITSKKNDFVAKVLTSYKITFKLNAQGTVVRINLEKDVLT
jgi:hypothetical protein